jgi:2-dehydropantoate 2-reductase
VAISKICIVGPGAIGGMIAVKLARAGFTVSALARTAKADAINANGITLHTGGEVLNARMKAATTGAALGPQDLVIVAVKNNALSAVAAELPALLGPKTPLLLAMNGMPWWFFEGFGGTLAGTRIDALDPDGMLARLIPLERVVWGVVNFSVHDRGDGAIEHTNARQILLGRPTDDAAGLDVLCDVLARGGYDCTISANIRRDVWSKLSINVAMNMATALTGGLIYQLVRDPMCNETISTALAEMRSVGVKLGIDPGPYPLDTYRNAQVKTSMLQDLERRRPLESASIVAAPLEVAAKAGMTMPVIRAMASLLLMRERIVLG